MEKPVNFFDLATGLFFLFFLLKLMQIGLRELRRERHERFMERPATWLQYSQPPLILIMIALVYAGIFTDYFRIKLPYSAGFLLRGAGALMIAAGVVLSFSVCSATSAVNIFPFLQEFPLRYRR